MPPTPQAKGRRDDQPRRPTQGRRSRRASSGVGSDTPWADGVPPWEEPWPPAVPAPVQVSGGPVSGGPVSGGPLPGERADHFDGGYFHGVDDAEAPAGEEADSGSADERPVRVVPVPRLTTAMVAGATLVLALGLIVGAQVNHRSYAFVVFAIQVLFVVVLATATRPPAPRIVMAVGLAVAAACDVAAVWTTQASLEPLAYVMAAGFVLGIVGQLVRPAGRIRVTESLGSSLAVVLGVVSLGTLVELTRHTRGTQALVACIGAAGIAVAVARLCDMVLVVPRLAPQVPRGGLGIVLGAMVGTGAAAVPGYNLAGLSTSKALIAGLVTALAALLADLSVGYAEASRQVDGNEPAMWISRNLQGPLSALAFAAPAAYACSVLLFDIL